MRQPSKRVFTISAVLCAVFCATLLGSAAKAQQPADFSRLIPKETQAVMVVRPQAIMEHPLIKQFGADNPDFAKEMTGSFEKDFGQPMSACQAFVMGKLDDVWVKEFEMDISQSFTLGVFAQPVDKQKILEMFRIDGEWEEATLGNKTYYKEKQDDEFDFANDPAFTMCVAFPAANVFVQTSAAKIGTVLGPAGDSELKSRAAALPQNQLLGAIFGATPIAELQASLAEEQGIPFGIAMHVPNLAKITFAQFAVSLDADNMVMVKLETASAEDAAAVEQSASQLLAIGKGLLPGVTGQVTNGNEEINQAITNLVNSVATSTKDNAASITVPKPDKETEAVLLEFVKGALTAARAAATEAQKLNNLRMVGIAAHNFNDVHGYMPPSWENAHRDEDGRPLLSWRVHLLPYLEEQELYDQFHLDEPWDSEHNKQLLSKMPDVFALSDKLPEGMTDVISPAGEDTYFGGSGKVTFANVLDGTSNTLMLFEASPEYAVPWTKPDDFVFDANAENAMARFGQPDAEEFAVMWGDGSVTRLKKSLSPQTILELIRLNDSKPTDTEGIR